MLGLPITSYRTLNYSSSYEYLPKWIAYLFVFTVFSRELGRIQIGGIDYDLIAYNFFILYFIFQVRSFFWSQRILVFLFLFLFCSVISKLYLGLSFSPLAKQFVPIALIYLVSYDFLCRYNYQKLFDFYYQLSFYSAIFGIIQVLLKVTFGIKLLTNYDQIFIDSIAQEPSHYTIIIIPAAIYGLYYFKENKVTALTLLIALLLTTSSTAYAVLMVMLVIVYRKTRYLFVIIPLLFFLLNNVLLSYDKFYIRFLGFSNYFETNSFSRVYAATSVSFLSNAEVAIATLKRNFLFGSGLGGHPEMYYRYYQGSGFSTLYLYGINAESAHSLIIRVASELGILGFALYIFGLFKGLLLRADDYHRIISIACLSHFVGKALKLGGYFDYGTPFFVMVLVFNYWDYKKSMNKNFSAQSVNNE